MERGKGMEQHGELVSRYLDKKSQRIIFGSLDFRHVSDDRNDDR